jgi:hypothetical protein
MRFFASLRMRTNAEAKATARTGNSEIQGSFDLALRACAQDDDNVRVVANETTKATAKMNAIAKATATGTTTATATRAAKATTTATAKARRRQS